jgi:hypothetical protein
MRNKDRIRPFCERLAAAWERCPDMRFGQLISNAYASECDRDPFYVEDEKSIQMIEAFTNISPYYQPKEE